ncbi:sensor histidine kinase [Paenibacillus piri]|nr:sensor histidine kinase [Paenibacillus piri]
MLKLHEQATQRLVQTFNELDRTAKWISRDYAVQRLAEGAAVRDSAEDRSLREYADILIRDLTAQMPQVAEMCLVFDETGYAICTQSPRGSALLEAARSAQHSNERSLAPLTLENRPQNGNEVVYSIPITDKRHVIRGSLQVLVEMNAVMKDIYGNMPLLGSRLIDSTGRTVYAGTAEDRSEHSPDEGRLVNGSVFVPDPVPLQWVDGSFTLQKRLDLPGAVWLSRIVVPQTLAAANKAALTRTLLLLILALLLLGAFCAFMLRRSFVEPLQRLRRLMNRAELGDFRAYWTRRSSSEWNELGESYNQMLNRLEELIRQVKREEALKKEAEMEALQYQLNPHFLYNTLNTIKWVAKMHRTPQIAEVVTSLVRLLQASLGKRGDFITVREEMELIRNYMDIQAFRYGDKIRLESEVDPLALGCLVPRMILQPLIENAIIHGIEPGRQQGWIRIRIWLETERELLLCQVEDDGVGIAAEEAAAAADENGGEAGSVNNKDAGEASRGKFPMRERMSGIGLRHIREKIRLYYGNGYSMHMTGKPNRGTTIRLTLPVHQSEEE